MATVPTEEITPGVVWLLGRVMVTLSPTATSDCSEASRAMLTWRVVEVAVSTVPPPPPSPTPLPTGGSSTPAPDGLADRRGDRGDPDGAGLEHHLAEQDLAGGGQAERGLPTFDRSGGGRGVVVALGQPGAVAEGDQVGGQLAHVGAVGHADVERPVGGDGAVEERHRFVVERVDGLVLLDDLAHLGSEV